MEVDDWQLNLVFEAPDGSFYDEPRRYHARLDEAVALARRDAALTTFGRTFRGFSKIDFAPAVVKPSQAPRAQHVPTSPVAPLESLLEKHKAKLPAPDAVAKESARHPVKLDGVDRFPWWDFEGAFGIATEVGLLLQRCASVDAREALDASVRLGDVLAHQEQLFPVTSHALPWMVELIESKDVTCRRQLASWLGVILESADAATDPVSKMLAFTARLVARDLSSAMSAHQRCAREVNTAMRALKPRLAALTGDPEIGARVKAMLAVL